MTVKNGPHVLIVDDDAYICDVVARALENAGFRASVANTATIGIRRIEKENPDIVILDVMLPDMNGVEVCRSLVRDRELPIILLTARGDEDDRLSGLEAGATDYVTKPFSVRELVARVKAVLRRVRPHYPQTAQVLKVGDIELNVDGYSVTVRGEPIALTRTELMLLRVLMEQAGRVVPKDRLCRAVWGTDRSSSHVLEVHISNLRRKIEVDPRSPKHLITVRSIGYKLVP